MIDLRQIAGKTEEIVRRTGAYIRKERSTFSQTSVEIKGLHDLVSYVDKAAEKQLVEALHALLPEAGFITEEKTTAQESKVYNWIIDPLDGTTNFIHGVPIYSVSVALSYQGDPVLGIVYEINRDECFLAWKNGGCFLNGGRASVSQKVNLDECLLATGFPFRKFDYFEPYIQVLKGLMQETRGIRRLGSAAVDLAYVACGRFDGFFEFNLNDYDIAAGIVLIREAGGVATDFSGGQGMLENGSIVGGSPALSQQLLQRIGDHFIDFGNHTL